MGKNFAEGHRRRKYFFEYFLTKTVCIKPESMATEMHLGRH